MQHSWAAEVPHLTKRVPLFYPSIYPVLWQLSLSSGNQKYFIRNESLLPSRKLKFNTTHLFLRRHSNCGRLKKTIRDILYYIRNQQDATLTVRLLVTARLLYMFRTLSASIIRSTKNCSSSHWCMGRGDIYPVRMSKVGCHSTSAVATDLRHHQEY